MKKSLAAILMAVFMLAMFVGPVAAAPLATERSATLVSVVYVAGKGPIFTFEVSGTFSNEELNGDLFVVGGEHFPLYCSQIDATTVKCVVSKKTAGKNVKFSWGGFQFSASVPVATSAVLLPCSLSSDTFINVDIQNQSNVTVDVYWIDYACQPVHYNSLAPSQSYTQGTFVTHPWQIINSVTKEVMMTVVATINGQIITVK